MTTPEFDKMTDRVRKLLAQAASVAGTPEAEVFEAKAMALMAQYGIDEADARASGAAPAVKIEKIRVEISGKYVETRVRFVGMLAGALNCEALFYKNPAKARSSIVTVYGMPSHLARLQFLVGALTPEMLKRADAARPDYWIAPGQLRVYRRSFLRGYGARVAYRLRQEGVKAQEGHTSGALVLVDDRKKAAQALADDHPNARMVKSAAQTRADGKQAGDAAGRRANIGGGHGLTGGRRALN